MTFVLAAPVAMWLVLRGGANDMLTSPPATPAPTPTATATPAPTPSRTPPAPDGRISLARLKNAELDIPRWPADNVPGPSGRLKFSNGTVVVPADSAFPFARDVIILGVTYGDVDGDGAQETLAEIGCLLSEAGSTQLVAFDRDAAGDIVTMGTVVATAGEIRAVAGDSVRVQDDGSVSVKVGDYQRCCGDETPQQWQVRRYGWDGHQFSQVGGPAAFPVNRWVTETGVKTGELVLGPAVDGVRRGTLTVTITYLRGARPDHVALTFYPPDGLQRDGSAWPLVRTNGTVSFTVDLPAPKQGGSRTYTFAFRRAVTVTGGNFSVELRGVTKQKDVLSESNPYNNEITVPIRTVD